MKPKLIIFESDLGSLDLSDQELASELTQWETHIDKDMRELNRRSLTPMAAHGTLWLLDIGRPEELEQAVFAGLEPEMVILLSGQAEQMASEAARLRPRILWSGSLPVSQLAEILRRMRGRLLARMEGIWNQDLHGPLTPPAREGEI